MGFTCLRDIAEVARIPFDADPGADDPIAPAPGGVRWRPTTDSGSSTTPWPGPAEEAWPQFRGWRVNYESVAYALADRVDAPPARWTGPRTPVPRPRNSDRSVRSTGSPPPAPAVTATPDRRHRRPRPGGSVAVPRVEHRVLPLPAQLAEGGRIEHQVATLRRGRARSTGTAMTRSTWEWATQATSPDRARTRAITRSTRSATSRADSPPGHAVGEQLPPGPVLADLGRGHPLVGAVVPLGQVRVDGHAVAQPGQLGGLPGPGQGAGQDGGESRSRPGGSRSARAWSSPFGEQGEVGPAGVAAGEAPLGLAVADQDASRGRARHPDSAPLRTPTTQALSRHGHQVRGVVCRRNDNGWNVPGRSGVKGSCRPYDDE